MVCPATESPRRGPRSAAGGDARRAILDAARQAFTTVGYTHTSMRGVARRAGVDAALVAYYFGTKERLFLASMEFPLNPREVIEETLDEPLETLGLALTRAALSAWTDASTPAVRNVVEAILGSADPWALLREYWMPVMVGALAERLECPHAEAEYRAALVVSQFAGLLITRVAAEIQPLTVADIDRLAEDVGGTIQRYLTGPLAGGS